MNQAMSSVKQFVKEWMLPIAMTVGAAAYLIYYFMPEPVHAAGPVLNRIVAIVQPLMLFAMLFLTFCKIEPRELRPLSLIHI